MTDKDYTLIAIVADRTGSMGQAADGEYTKAQRTTDGIHSLVTQQRKLGRTEFTLTAFDSVGIDKIPPGNGDDILQWTCVPRGATPLLDAVGVTITEVGEQLSKMPEDMRPGRVIFVIATDGEENSSKEYSKQQVSDMITHQADVYSWDFLFIGADLDAFAEAGSIGIAQASTMPTSSAAYAAAWSSSNDAIARNRLSGMPISYSLADRQKVQDAEDAADGGTATG